MKIMHLIGLIALTATLTACHQGNVASVDGTLITLHADNAPAATISAQGDLRIDKTSVDLSAAQRRLLTRYHDGIMAIDSSRKALTQTSTDVAGKSMKLAGKSIKQAVGLGHDSSSALAAAEQDINRAGDAIGKKALALCTRLEKIRNLQAALDRQLDAFKPYADIDPAPGVHCNQTSSSTTT